MIKPINLVQLNWIGAFHTRYEGYLSKREYQRELKALYSILEDLK